MKNQNFGTIQTANQNAVFGMGPQFKLTTMLELEPFSDEEIPLEQNMQMLQDYFDTAAQRQQAWQRQTKGYGDLMKIKFDEPSVSVTETELQLEEAQHIQLGKRPRSASVTETQSEHELEESIPSQPNKRPCVRESIFIPAAEESIFIPAAEESIFIPAAEEPIFIPAAEEPILIPEVEDNDSDSEVEFLEEVCSLPTKPHEVENTFNMVKFIGKSNQERFDIGGMASQYIIDITCRLVSATNMYTKKAILSAEKVMSLSPAQTFRRQVELMKEWIGGSDTTFIPCLEGGHWTLVILFSTVKNLKHTHRVVVVDSWKPLGHKQKIGTLAQTVAKAASKAMWDKTVTPKLANNPAIQANDYDCGYFVLENIIWGCADFAGVVEELDGKRQPRAQPWVSSNKLSLGAFYRKASAYESLDTVIDGFMQYLVRHYAKLSYRVTFGEGWTSSDVSDVSE